MKPKNKHQASIIALRDTLPVITAEQIEYAKGKHPKYLAITHKTGHHCLSCGHSWKQPKEDKTTCPSCETKLKYQPNYKNGYAQRYYFGIITAKDSYQIVRMFQSSMSYKRGQKPNHSISEVMQHYVCTQSGTIDSIAAPVQSMSMYYDLWQHGELEFRTFSYNCKLRYEADCLYIYPKMQIHPIIKRNGFISSFHGITPHLLFSGLIRHNRIETLFKLKQYRLAEHCLDGPYHFPQYMIAIRHGYKITDIKTYDDYLTQLETLGKDLKNPFYICPADLEQAHQRLTNKIADLQRKKEAAKRKAEIDDYEPIYQERIQPFVNIEITYKGITIKPIPTVMGIYEEGEALRHCVFSSDYHKEENSLILSAQSKGERLETIEINLRTLKIEQAHGYKNKPTKKHRTIIKMMEENLHQIANCILFNHHLLIT